MSRGGGYLVSQHRLTHSFLIFFERLWLHLTEAIAEKNMERAQEAKSAVEDAQRDLRKKREERGERHIPRFFLQSSDGRWLPNLQCVYQFNRTFISG